MSMSYKSNGCPGGQCRTVRDVVSRPSLYTRCGCAASCSCGCQQGQQCACEHAAQKQPPRPAPSGVGGASTFTAPQPPPVHVATAAFGYTKGGAPPQGYQKGGYGPPHGYPSTLPCPDHHPQDALRYASKCGSGKCGGSSCSSCGSSKVSLSTPAAAPSSATGFASRPSRAIELVGKLVCLKCFGQDRRNHGADHILGDGKVMEGCARKCAEAGNPVGLLEHGSGRAYVLLTQAPKLAPYMSKPVHVEGLVAGEDVAHNAAVLVKALRVQKEDGNWHTVLVHAGQQ